MPKQVTAAKPRRKPGRIPNERIKNLLDNVGRFMSVAEIMDALECDYDDVHEVCARLRGMEKRPRQRVVSMAQDGRKLYRRIPE